MVHHLPHRPGHPGATLVHVIGCAPGGQRLNREQALTGLGQPRTTACKECDAAGSLASGDEPRLLEAARGQPVPIAPVLPR
ncbi:DUF6233 domain-containing protein [Streptomyces sp. NBC_01717]|uniref:DUF6233 domain-containing protein n=1 Tax=Streptomyces sp. NBC_01717 TaxID=2975918 RepID=UPI003FCE8749